MIGRNDPCFCGSGKKWKKCHFPTRPPSSLAEQYLKQYQITLKNPKQIEGIKAACKLTAQILDEACKMAKEGVTTAEIDAHVYKLHKDAGAIPAPLHYGEPPFPNSICTSLNEMVCHGIPNDTPLKEGDIMNIDVSSIYKGFIGDSSRMVTIGKTTPEKAHVRDVSLECLNRAMAICKPGALISQIGDVICDYAEEKGCSVIYQFVAHGVGLKFHEPPQVPHNRNNVHIPMAPGMTFTIEPMINAGTVEIEIDPTNQWEARTKDRKASAQWEHTILITEDGHEILTCL